MHYDFDEVHNRLGTYCTQSDLWLYKMESS